MAETKKNDDFETTHKLLMHCGFSGMAGQLAVLDESGELYEMSALQAVNSLVREEMNIRSDKRSQYLKSRAHLYIPQADKSDIDFDPKRKLNKPLIEQLATNAYIRNGRSIMINAATGSGKTYFACMFGNCACEAGYSVSYYHMSDLFLDYHSEKLKGSNIKAFIKKVSNVDLLILDDFMLTSVAIDEAEFLYKVLNYKRPTGKNRSYILCSQLMREEIYIRLMESAATLADAVMDRISHGAYQLHIDGPSMREKNVVLDENEQKALAADSQENREEVQNDGSYSSGV